RFHSVKIEARAPLHWWVIDERLEFLGHHLLDEHKTPELILEPIEVLLRSVLCPVSGPTLTFERIEPQVDQVGHVRVGLLTQPALGLVNKAELVVVEPHRADRAFAEIEDFVTSGWPFAGNSIHLVVAIEVVLVSPVAKLHTLE